MSRRSRRIRNPKQQKEGIKEPFFNGGTAHSEKAFFQAKELSVGKPGDKYEKEADTVADAVVNEGPTGPNVQEKEISSIQRTTLSSPKEDEKLSTAEQRMEEDKLIQEQPEEEEEPVQMQEEEEEPIQAQTDMEEEEPVQAKPEGTAKCASQGVSSKIQSEKGKGKPLSGKVKKEMEHAFKVDLSDVQIHTDEKAESLSKKLKAQAFTCGKDIFFNDGKYKPEQHSGKKLLAHELTHVIQQQKGKK